MQTEFHLAVFQPAWYWEKRGDRKASWQLGDTSQWEHDQTYPTGNCGWKNVVWSCHIWTDWKWICNQPPTHLLKKCQLAVGKSKRAKIRKEKRSGLVWEEKRYRRGLLGGTWVQCHGIPSVLSGKLNLSETMQGLFLVKLFTAVILTKHEICSKQTKSNDEYE